MIFQQFFDDISSTYTYLISSGKGREALIIDPVLEKTDQYINLLNQLELRLVKVIDTHIHADHISGLPELREKTQCITIMGEQAPADIVSMKVRDNEIIKIPVTFAFRWWETLDVNRQAPSLKEKIFSTVINTVERNISRNIPSVISKLGN